MLTETELWQGMSIIASVQPLIDHADFLCRGGWRLKALGYDEEAKQFWDEAERARTHAQEKRAKILGREAPTQFDGLKRLITTGIDVSGVKGYLADL